MDTHALTKRNATSKSQKRSPVEDGDVRARLRERNAKCFAKATGATRDDDGAPELHELCSLVGGRRHG